MVFMVVLFCFLGHSDLLPCIYFYCSSTAQALKKLELHTMTCAFTSFERGSSVHHNSMDAGLEITAGYMQVKMTFQIHFWQVMTNFWKVKMFNNL